MVVPFGVSPTALHPLVEPQYNQAEVFMDDQPWPEGGKMVDFSLLSCFFGQSPGSQSGGSEDQYSRSEF
jgi:hypothetical protein